MIPALLLAAAAAVLLGRSSSRGRLVTVLPREDVEPTRRPRLQTVIFLVAAAGLLVALPGVLGVVLAVTVVLGGPRLLGRLDDGEEQAREQVVTADLPLALDLLAACLHGGATLRAALEAVRDAVPGPCGQRFGRVAAALAVGAPEEDAFRALGEDRGPAGSAARALSRAAAGGTPVAAAVSRVAVEARRTAAVQAEKRAKRAGVLAVGPLTACFLPAFVLIGVVPTVLGLMAPVLASL